MQSLKAYLTKEGWKEDLDETIDDLCNGIFKAIDTPGIPTITIFAAGGLMGYTGSLFFPITMDPSQPLYEQMYQGLKILAGVGLGGLSFATAVLSWPIALADISRIGINYEKKLEKNSKTGDENANTRTI